MRHPAIKAQPAAGFKRPVARTLHNLKENTPPVPEPEFALVQGARFLAITGLTLFAGLH